MSGVNTKVYSSGNGNGSYSGFNHPAQHIEQTHLIIARVARQSAITTRKVLHEKVLHEKVLQACLLSLQEARARSTY